MSASNNVRIQRPGAGHVLARSAPSCSPPVRPECIVIEPGTLSVMRDATSLIVAEDRRESEPPAAIVAKTVLIIGGQDGEEFGTGRRGFRHLSA